MMKLRILLSYWYFKNNNIDELLEKYFTEPYPDIFADSGAYSAMTQGGSVSLEEYGSWIKRNEKHFSAYANLDVIKDAEKTLENQKRLEDLGISPIPAFHVTEDWKYLEYYLERYSYIALGVAGMQARRDAIMRWLINCFYLAKDKSVFHGFGLTSWKVMNSFPWYSVDSSSWSGGFRFGRVPLFDSRSGNFQKVRTGDPRSVGKYAHLIREIGYDPYDLAKAQFANREMICSISGISYVRAEEWLRSRWGEISIPGKEEKGLKLFLANPNASDLSMSEKGIKLYLATWTPDIKSGENSNFVGGDIQWKTFGKLQKGE